MQPIGVDEAAQGAAVPLSVQQMPTRSRGRRLPWLPLWLRLLLHNPKSCIGLILLGGMVAVAVFAPLIATHDPTAYSLLDAKQSPSMHHFFGTTDQGTDVFSQVVLGTRNSLFLGLAAATLATVLAATLGILAAYSGGWVDDVINFAINVFLVIPTIPLLIVASAYLKNRGSTSMILILGTHAVGVRGAHPARPGADAAQSRLHPGRQGGRRADLAHRLVRVDAEHGQPYRGGVRARLLRLAS